MSAQNDDGQLLESVPVRRRRSAKVLGHGDAGLRFVLTRRVAGASRSPYEPIRTAIAAETDLMGARA
ncbi:hypothetical protein [Streptomyces sp. NPDC087212]|uniref:hypothetical protein n=1 Tax=Streptomyces sp. NPDC087212 TaxID=3365766 RepID=UPI0037F22DC4